MSDKTKNGYGYGLRLAAIVGSTILGLVTIIGIFWGKQGIANFGIGLGILAILLFMMFISALTNPT